MRRPNIDIQLATDEGILMLDAFRAERGLADLEETGILDPIVSLLHAQQADTGESIFDLVCEAFTAIATFREEAASPRTQRLCDRLGMNLPGRLDAVLRAATMGDDRLARRELLALLEFFPPGAKGQSRCKGTRNPRLRARTRARHP